MKNSAMMLCIITFTTFGILQPVNAADAIYTGYFSNKAVSGYDVVAYFNKQKTIEGNGRYTTEYQGADWYFSSHENLTLFIAAPHQYAPQYGGYCAWAMAGDYTASGNPPFWTLYNNKLYLNYDQSVSDTWQANKDHFIQQADLNWAKLEKEL